MSKFFQAFLTGVFFTFILDFFLFLGIKLNYIDVIEIDLYYNILFADNQNIYIYLLFSAIIGYLVMYVNYYKLSAFIIGTLFVIVSLTLIEPIGYSVAQMIFMKKNVTLYDKKFTYKGDIYYDGRDNITFYDYELNKIILLDKKDLKQ